MKLTRKDFLAASAATVVTRLFATDGDPVDRPVFVKGSDVFRKETSQATLERLLAAGGSPVFVDVQDSIAYSSHPEIATANSLPAEKAAKIVEHYRGKGVVLMPLLDFATCGDSWLGVYDRMVCSKAYRQVVEDVIREAYAVFGKPACMHIGFEAEGQTTVEPNGLAVMRQGDLWMREFNWTVGLVEATGATCWAWFDYPWGIKDFLAGCPRSVIYVNFRAIDEKLANKIGQLEKTGAKVVRREVAK